MKNSDSICCFRSREESRDRRVCWEITTACNLKCSFCHRANFENEFYDYQNIEQTIGLLKEHAITNVIISGGEPLLHPHFFDIVRRLREEKFEIDVCSNGVLFDDNKLVTLRNFLSEISISLDGYEPGRHDQMRGLKGSFEKTIINIKKLIEHGFDVHITTVVDSQFAGEIVKTVDFLNALGIKTVSFLGLIPIDSGENNIFHDDCQRKLIDQISEVRTKYPEMVINTKQLLCEQSKCNCGAGNIIFGLGTDGIELVPCLLTRKREGKDERKIGPGLCPGSKYLTARRKKC